MEINSHLLGHKKPPWLHFPLKWNLREFWFWAEQSGVNVGRVVPKALTIPLPIPFDPPVTIATLLRYLTDMSPGMKKKGFLKSSTGFLSPKFQPPFVLLPSGTSETTDFRLKKQGKSQEFREQEKINDVSKDTKVRDEAGKTAIVTWPAPSLTLL